MSHILRDDEDDAVFAKTKVLQPYISPSVPKYLSNYPEISEAVQTVKDIVMEWRAPTSTNMFELEARLGKLGSDRFQPGVSVHFMEKVVNMMNTYQQWSEVTPWTETHDYYYANGADASLPPVRTTAQFEIDSDTQKRRVKTSHMRKFNIRKYDYLFMSQSVKLPTDHYQYDLRISLNREESVPASELPRIVNPTFMRIKSRKTYFYTSEDSPASKPIWRFDLTKSWSAPTKTQAEIKQRTEDPVFEIELECINPMALMTSPKHDAFYVACSMLLKMKDFITFLSNGETFKWSPAADYTNASLQSTVTCF